MESSPSLRHSPDSRPPKRQRVNGSSGESARSQSRSKESFDRAAASDDFDDLSRHQQDVQAEKQSRTDIKYAHSSTQTIDLCEFCSISDDAEKHSAPCSHLYHTHCLEDWQANLRNPGPSSLCQNRFCIYDLRDFLRSFCPSKTVHGLGPEAQPAGDGTQKVSQTGSTQASQGNVSIQAAGQKDVATSSRTGENTAKPSPPVQEEAGAALEEYSGENTAKMTDSANATEDREIISILDSDEEMFFAEAPGYAQSDHHDQYSTRSIPDSEDSIESPGLEGTPSAETGAEDNAKEVPHLEAYMSQLGEDVTGEQRQTVRTRFTKMWQTYNLSIKDAAGFMAGKNIGIDLVRLAQSYQMVEDMLSKDFNPESIIRMFLDLRSHAATLSHVDVLRAKLDVFYQGNTARYDELGSDWAICFYATAEDDQLLKRGKELYACLQVAEKVLHRSRGLVSVGDVIDSFVERETELRTSSVMGTPADRRKEWERRKVTGSRLKDVTDKLGIGLLLFAPASVEANKVNRWSREVGRMLAHCIDQDTTLGKQIRALSTICEQHVGSFLKLSGRNTIPAAIDAIETYYVAKIFRLGKSVRLQDYRGKILQISHLPPTQVSQQKIPIHMDDIKSLVGTAWPTPAAGHALMRRLHGFYLGSCDTRMWRLEKLHRFELSHGPYGLGLMDRELKLSTKIGNLVPVYQQTGDAASNDASKGSWLLIKITTANEPGEIYYYHATAQLSAQCVGRFLDDYMATAHPEMHALKRSYDPVECSIQVLEDCPQDQLFALLRHIPLLFKDEVVEPDILNSQLPRENSVLDLFDAVLEAAFPDEVESFDELNAGLGWEDMGRNFTVG